MATSQGTIQITQGSIKGVHIAAGADLPLAGMAQRANAVLPIRPTDWRVWDALQTVLSGTPASDDLGIATGTFGTNQPYISTGDVKGLGATTRRARALIPIPENYDPTQTVALKLWAGMTTAIADTTATIDVEAYAIDKDGTISADLCSTALQSINATSAAAKTFSLNATDLVGGVVLDVRVTIAVNDALTAIGTVIGALYQTELLATLRG